MTLQWQRRGKSWEARYHGVVVVVERCPRKGWYVLSLLEDGPIACGFRTGRAAKAWANGRYRTGCPWPICNWVADPTAGHSWANSYTGSFVVDPDEEIPF